MNRNEIVKSLDPFKDTFVASYNAWKLKSGVPSNLVGAAKKHDIIRYYYGLQYYNPDGTWSQPKWNPSLSERWFFFRHRMLSKLLGKSYKFSEQDQQRLWTIRGGENYSFESETPESREFARRFFTDFFEKVPLDKDASILELGCGSGRNLLLLREMGFTNLHGVDFSPSQVEFSVQQGLDAKIMNISDLEFDDNSFDFVYTNSVLLHVPPDKIEKVIHEAVRVSSSIVAFREDLHKENTNEGHVYKRDYVGLIEKLGYKTEIVGEFIRITWD